MRSQINNKRIEWIDVAKGYGMILVIWGHMVNGKLDLWFNSFHMPLFFFLSGYVFQYKEGFKTFLKKKAKALVVPYFCLGIPMLLFQLMLNVLNNSFSVESTIDLITVFLLQNRIWTLWYMACLFFLCIIFYFVVKVCKKPEWIALVSLLFAVAGGVYYQNGGVPLFWSIDVCFTAMPFFMCGYLLKVYAQRIEQKIIKKRTWLFLGALCGLVNIVLHISSLDEAGVGMHMAFMKYGNPLFSYGAAFSGVLMVICFAKVFPLSFVKYIGKNSLLYYAWHQTIIFPIVFALLKPIENKIGDGSYYLMAVCLVFAILTVLNVIKESIEYEKIYKNCSSRSLD